MSAFLPSYLPVALMISGAMYAKVPTCRTARLIKCHVNTQHIEPASTYNAHAHCWPLII